MHAKLETLFQEEPSLDAPFEPEVPLPSPLPSEEGEREFFINNLMVRVHHLD